MKFVHDNQPDKVYYITESWHGGGATMKEHFNGCFRTKIELSSIEYKKMLERLAENGWKESIR
jgi:hypothetical protein